MADLHPSARSSPPEGPLDLRWLGRVPYEEARDLQHRLVREIAEGHAPETLLMVEHDAVFTVGRRRDARLNVLDPGPIPVVEVERGGDATYHGPGQLVAYPLVRLGPGEQDLHRYMRNLEGAVIALLGRYGIEGAHVPGQTGVWVGERKIASVGVAVRRWVTYHGLALNVSTELGPFHRLHPCGLPASVMTSWQALGQSPAPELAAVAAELGPLLAEALGR